MKTKLFLLAALAFVTLKSNAQNYLISFAGSGTATTVDSIKVENLTHAATVKLVAGDILNLFGNDGIKEINVNDETIKVNPNPMQGQDEISFYAKESGIAQLSIYDISGRKIIQTEDNFSQGIQKYQLSGLSKGMYFINVSGENYFYTAKLMSMNSTQSEAKIKYVESPVVSDKQETHTSKSKSTKATVPMAYVTGDNLRYTGYSPYNTEPAIINDVPTSSKTVTFTFIFNNCGTVTDIDNNTYNTVSIGTQCWMRENLKTTRYSNGSAMLDGTSAGNINGNYTTKYYFDYNNDPANTVIYGKLYTWAAVMNGAASSDAHPSGVQGVCPTGWHVPSDAEWNVMEIYLDNTIDTTTTSWIGTDIGDKLKESGTSHWASTNNGTNSSGFTALPGGTRYGSGGTFNNVGNDGYWWSATESNVAHAWYRYLSYGNSDLNGNDFLSETYGFSVRCVKDY